MVEGTRFFTHARPTANRQGAGKPTCRLFNLSSSTLMPARMPSTREPAMLMLVPASLLLQIFVAALVSHDLHSLDQEPDCTSIGHSNNLLRLMNGDPTQTVLSAKPLNWGCAVILLATAMQ